MKQLDIEFMDFLFKFKNAPANLKSILNPQDDLINNGDKDNLEEANNNFTNEFFFPAKKQLKKKWLNIKLFQQQIL